MKLLRTLTQTKDGYFKSFLDFQSTSDHVGFFSWYIIWGSRMCPNICASLKEASLLNVIVTKVSRNFSPQLLIVQPKYQYWSVKSDCMIYIGSLWAKLQYYVVTKFLSLEEIQLLLEKIVPPKGRCSNTLTQAATFQRLR